MLFFSNESPFSETRLQSDAGNAFRQLLLRDRNWRNGQVALPSSGRDSIMLSARLSLTRLGTRSSDSGSVSSKLLLRRSVLRWIHAK